MKISRDINLSSDAFTTSKAQQISPAKTSAPKSDVPPVSQDDLTKINALVGEFLSDNSELASRDMHRLLCLLTKDQSFQTFLEENTKFRICEKAAEGDSQVTYPDVSRENILREMLKGEGD
ncbi:hypothetical protein QRZ34_28495 [Klebsiella michiganensis]|uniref:hypothetical protein n=1 Tax=Klebsiella michiganensis TaxID=1134687 RepID=UPI0025702148|nr:hypothetical protein [Klebsiella michiganensis]MDL4454935.1 hypothetical protein [Klebsiella michiganensis]